MTPSDMYLDLLIKSLTNTVFESEPDHDADNGLFVTQFTMHYIRGEAITMLPRVRLANLRSCVETILAENVPGDLIETGVWRGGACILMRACLDVSGALDRTVWLADSFEGLPDPGPQSERESSFYHSEMMQKHFRRMAASIDDVRGNFEAYGLLSERVRFLKGWFDETLPTAPIDRLSVLRLDGDYYKSTMDALGSLYDKVSPGGFIIVDDYGEDLWTDCRKAIDQFRRERNIADPLVPVDSKCVFWRKSAAA